MDALIYFLVFSVGFNLILFLFAYLFQTDKITDLSYSLSFLLIAIYALMNSEISEIDQILFLLVCIWAIRLGTYLVIRIRKTGTDKRFDEIRKRFVSFLLFWLMQGITGFVVMIPIILTLQETHKMPSVLFWMGCILAFIGFLIEGIADHQKFKFKNKHPNQHMRYSLWAFVQHPNYSGELLFWWGIYLASISYIPWYLGLIGPVWISFIIIKFSGIPILQKRWKNQYGDDPAFNKYQSQHKKIIPYIY